MRFVITRSLSHGCGCVDIESYAVDGIDEVVAQLYNLTVYKPYKLVSVVQLKEEDEDENMAG